MVAAASLRMLVTPLCGEGLRCAPQVLDAVLSALVVPAESGSGPAMRSMSSDADSEVDADDIDEDDISADDESVPSELAGFRDDDSERPEGVPANLVPMAMEALMMSPFHPM